MTTAERIVALLTEIRDLLAGPMPSAPSDLETIDCAHPEEARIHLQAMGDPGAFYKCRACGVIVRHSANKE